jgi:hypothetical protein
MMLSLAQRRGWHWTVDLLPDPDRELIAAETAVATSDSVILDGCRRWTNLARHIIGRHVPSAWVVDLSCAVSPSPV